VRRRYVNDSGDVGGVGQRERTATYRRLQGSKGLQRVAVNLWCIGNLDAAGADGGLNGLLP
jgi:hypothetical protein